MNRLNLEERTRAYDKGRCCADRLRVKGTCKLITKTVRSTLIDCLQGFCTSYTCDCHDDPCYSDQLQVIGK
jgi:hypothetical protein